MFVPTSAMIRTILVNELDATPAAAGLLSDLDIRLFENNLTPTRDTAFAGIVEPTFAGYTPVVVVNPTPTYLDPNSQGRAFNAPAAFQPTADPASPVMVYGYALVDPNGPTLMGAERFATPMIFTTTSDALAFIAQIILGGIDNEWGTAVIVS